MSRGDAIETVGRAAHIPYVPVLDGVRAVSIVLVILTHTAPLGPSSWEFNEMAGPMGMSLFFCLSGYLIVSILSRSPDVPAFLIRRVLRIVPALVLYLCVVTLVFGMTFRGWMENILFVGNYFWEGRGRQGAPDAPLSHLWSLSVEMQFYVAIALSVLLLGRRAVWLVPPAALVITGLRIESGVYTNIATHLRVDEILSGGTLALVAMHLGGRLRTHLSSAPRAWILLGIVTLLWMVSCHPAGGPVNYARPYLAATLVGILMYARFGRLHDVLEGQVAAYVAKTSYALYIWHPMMVFGWMNEGSDAVRYLLKRPVSWALTLAAAHVSTFYWEQPWQRLAKRLTAHRKAVVA